MSEPKKRRSDWTVWLVVGIAMPFLYALSVGPVAWLGEMRFLPPPIENAIVVFYGPLELAYENNQAFQIVMDGYLSVWQRLLIR